ncbi:MAG: hypothetical protein JNL17_00415 [Cyclobacteriaceae bacterium]|nr:hypothetical protein [Cyclobacteriaceae bacterium]
MKGYSKYYLIASVLVLLTIVLTLNLLNRSEQKVIEYYPSGGIKAELTTVDGRQHGTATQYYESGKLKIKANYENGLLSGPYTIYFESGAVNQVSYFFRGRRVNTSRLYDDDGSLLVERFYDSLGRETNYIRYKNGAQDNDPLTKQVMIFSRTDTVALGDFFEAIVRLGNRKARTISVVIGDVSNPQKLALGPKLPMEDSITSILRIKANQLGLQSVQGIVFELNGDTLSAFPFRKSFFVR